MSNFINREILPPLVDEYITELIVVKGRSELTVNEYTSDLRLFFRFLVSRELNIPSPADLEENFDLSYIDANYMNKITLKDVTEFIIYCSTDRTNNKTTRARKASSLRGFFKYIADKMHYIDQNPVSQLQVAKSDKKLPKYLTLEQSRSLLASVKEPNKERDYCILTIFLNCGLRLAELVNLNVSDINLNEQTMIVTGKGNKQRMVFLNKACIIALEKYLRVRPADQLKGEDRKALFISRLNKRMGRQAVQLMVYRYLEAIGLNGQHYSVHKLRHTAATLMYQHGNVDVLVLKEVLGHENIATTEIYTHIDSRQLRDAAKSNPLSMEND
ncbi:MAG: tyrosine recombinase XerC [Acutalibacteraceae bacterium]|nr:tyrosine recombinase XerC [Acutalibacteraceae bacterium]